VRNLINDCQVKIIGKAIQVSLTGRGVLGYLSRWFISLVGVTAIGVTAIGGRI